MLKKIVLVGFVGDAPEALKLRQFADADFAAIARGSNPHPGIPFLWQGRTLTSPLSAKAVRQTCVARSIPEAEMVSTNSAIRLMGLPSLDRWEVVIGRKIALDLIEDNDSTVHIFKTGRNPHYASHVSNTSSQCYVAPRHVP